MAKRALLTLLLLPVLAAPVAAAPASAPSGKAAAAAPKVNEAQWPSFLMPNEVLCFDELDFNAFAKSGRFHTRGSVESCTRVGELTRVVVMAQSGTKSQVLVVTGPLASHVGWTNGRLPIAGPKPTKP